MFMACAVACFLPTPHAPRRPLTAAVLYIFFPCLDTIPHPESEHAIVAVTATIRAEDGVPRVRLPAAYLAVLERAGLVPIVLPPFNGPPSEVAAAVGRVLNAVDALVLTGGEDVDPACYGAAPSPQLGRTNAARDATEIAAVLAAAQRGLPTLAICRGIQVLNVALGGTLIQDIPSERPQALAHDPDAPRDTRTHPVQADRGLPCGESARRNRAAGQLGPSPGDRPSRTGTRGDGDRARRDRGGGGKRR